MCRREKELAERELELARREIAMLRANERAGAANPVNGNDDNAVALPTMNKRMNLTTIADLVNEFDGVSSDYDTWEKQIKFIKTTYRLEDDFAKVLIGMKLKKKALEWFHSKPEHIEMTFDALIGEIKKMFRHHQSKVTLRKKFEGRLWKKDETFHEYVHEKMILGNRVPIADDEMLDYVIDGIPDNTLRDQARIQRFDTAESLLEAFEKIQAFLGLAGHYRKFIPGYSTIARPLSDLLRANVKFNFGAAQKEAFTRLKILLSERPVLNLYRVGAYTELHTDASMHGYGAILLQRDNEDQLLHPVYYASGKTTPAEEKYTSYELEVLAVIKALKRFRVYLLGIPFKVVTDCRAFALTMSKKAFSQRNEEDDGYEALLQLRVT
ncbi:PREDICTED: uncharacterized protein LOC105447791 [Wasmannia auropunctata]|uniref:uncharacterized protein LOC105447791 n=1 Tax=Wasmannia auropunctata TaxID=64793 RepID=UPI0005EE8185|nr:PREDICTED: uncharacterized protein LOC105447791 [Wasmannia auropunctata]